MSMASMFKEYRTDVGILLMAGKGIKGGICHAIHRYVKVNNRYMKNQTIIIYSVFRCK